MDRTMSRTLTYDRTSSPATIKIHMHPIPPAPNDDKVLIQFLASPINRVDLMLLSGQYPVQPRHHHAGHPIPGFDGVGVVLASPATNPSNKFRPGDLVLPRDLGRGTWRTHAALPPSSLLRLPPATPPRAAALLRSGAVLAALLLDEVLSRASSSPSPGPGPVVCIMSAGTSALARFLVQLARPRGVDVVLVVRDRPADQLARAEAELVGLGARAVVTEARLAAGLYDDDDVQGAAAVGKRPSVALDCVFGHVGQLLVETLAPGGTFVLVGMLGGAGTGVRVETGHLFTRQLSFVPFRGSEVLRRMGDARAEQLFTDVANHFIEGRLKLPELNFISWNDQPDEAALEKVVGEALEDLSSNRVGYRKSIFVF